MLTGEIASQQFGRGPYDGECDEKLATRQGEVKYYSPTDADDAALVLARFGPAPALLVRFFRIPDVRAFFWPAVFFGALADSPSARFFAHRRRRAS